MMMYYHKNNDDYEFILMWFIDLGDEGHGVTSEEHDGDHNSTSCVCENHGKSFLILTGYQNCRSYTRHEHSIGEKDFISC